jgi:putative methyltransferase (TIGR04325 family)
MWSVIEQPHFVACGKADFEDEVLKFTIRSRKLRVRQRFDVVLFSGALRCLPKPFDFLAICADMGVPHILIDRHPETDAEEDHIEIQARPRTDLQGELPAPDLCKGTVREI